MEELDREPHKSSVAMFPLKLEMASRKSAHQKPQLTSVLRQATQGSHGFPKPKNLQGQATCKRASYCAPSSGP